MPQPGFRKESPSSSRAGSDDAVEVNTNDTIGFPSLIALRFLGDGAEVFNVLVDEADRNIVRMELALAVALAFTPGPFVSLETLQDHLQVGCRDVYRYVDRLRNKLGDKRYVEHVRCRSTGVSGYKLRCVRVSFIDVTGIETASMMPGSSALHLVETSVPGLEVKAYETEVREDG